MSYKVSVVIPIYNVSPYIERCLESAFNQNFQSIEYLLIDDRGNDNSIEIAKAFIDKHPRKNDIKIIDHGSNIGLGATRNTGIDLAKGEYIFFLDSDDKISYDTIKKLYEKVIESQVDFVVGSYISLNFSENFIDIREERKVILDNRIVKGKFEVAKHFLSGRYNVMSWNKLYKTSFLRENNIKCIKNSNHEDEFFSFQIALCAQSMATISDITYFYNIREGSIMEIFKEKNFNDHLTTMKEMTNYLEMFEKTEIYNSAVYYLYGFRSKIINTLNGSQHIHLKIRIDLTKKMSNSFLSFEKINTLVNVSLNRRWKYYFTLLSFKFERLLLFLLKIIYPLTKYFGFRSEK